MLAAQRAKRRAEVTPKITGAQRHGPDALHAGRNRRLELAPKIGLAAPPQGQQQQPSWQQDPLLAMFWRGPYMHAGAHVVEEEAPPAFSEEEERQRVAIKDALKRELESTDIHMSVLKARQAVLSDRLASLEGGGPTPMLFL